METELAGMTCPWSSGEYQVTIDESSSTENLCDGDAASIATVDDDTITLDTCSSTETYSMLLRHHIITCHFNIPILSVCLCHRHTSVSSPFKRIQRSRYEGWDTSFTWALVSWYLYANAANDVWWEQVVYCHWVGHYLLLQRARFLVFIPQIPLSPRCLVCVIYMLNLTHQSTQLDIKHL